MTSDSRRSSASHKHWKLNWWNLWPLVDGERRPMQWTNNSLILSPHPTSPMVTGRIFPSKSTFVLPLPPVLHNNLNAYDPPKIIEVSSGDEYVFAFFEAKTVGADNFACIWTRGEALDVWKISIPWPLKPGQGIVSAKWIGTDRMWRSGSESSCSRAPPLGPVNPLGKTILILVSQNHLVQVIYRMSTSSEFKLFLASLRHATQVSISDPVNQPDMTNTRGGMKICTRAAIGLGYDESSIIIATSSSLIYSQMNPHFEFSDNTTTPSTPPAGPIQSPWDTFGPEQAIQLCEVKLTSHNFIMGISTNPLQPIFPQVASSARLTDMLVVPHLNVENQTDTGMSASEASIPNNKNGSNLLQVVLAYLDLEDFLSLKSELLCFQLKRCAKSPPESSKSVAWIHRHLHTRTIMNSAVSFLLPPRNPGPAQVFAGLLDFEGSVPRLANGDIKSKQVVIGHIVRLKLPNFEDDNTWERSQLMNSTDDAGRDPPISAVASPGDLLIFTSPSMRSALPTLGLHPLPQIKEFSPSYSPAALSGTLQAAILSDTQPTDLVHVMGNPTFPLSSAVQVLEDTLQALTRDNFSARDYHSQIAGIALDIFRTHLNRLSKENSTNSQEAGWLIERSQVALEVCSMKTVKNAFEACKEDDGYDMGSVWNLIALSTWLVEFCERLLRVSVLWADSRAVQKAHSAPDSTVVKTENMEVDDSPNALFDEPPSLAADAASPPLIHISHPYALENFIGALSHLNAFRAYLDTLTASRMKAGIAKNVIVDVIDESGIEFSQLEAELRKVPQIEGFTSLNAELHHRCFCTMCPLSPTHDVLEKACNGITTPEVVSKPRLFIKPSDLVDGISRLNLATAKSSQERDVISKGVLGMPAMARTCARCGGKTELGRSKMPRAMELKTYGSWAVWEREWERCICGGTWITETAH